MMKKVVSAVILGAALLTTVLASAQGGATGVITGVMILNSYGVVTVTNPVGTAPSCHNLGAGQYAFDISTAKGKAYLSAIEGAQIAGKTVGVGGGTACFTIQTGQNVQTLDIITVF